jgi:hypothetical protein
MRPHRTELVLIVWAGVAFTTACDTVERVRGRASKATTDTVLTATGSGLALGLQAPPALRPGDEGLIRLSLTNQTDTAISHVRLELIVPAWVEPMPPRVGDRPVTMAALATGGTQFSYRLEDNPLNPRQLQTLDQRIRVPSSGIPARGAALWTRAVKARLLTADGRALAEVQTEISVDSAAIAAATTTAEVTTVNRRERLGAVELGMTAAAVKQAAPSTKDTTWTQAGVQQRGLLVPVADRTAVAVLTGDEVTRVEVAHPAIHTAEGLGVDSRMDDLQRAYGSPCVDINAGRVVVRFAAAPGIAFAIDAAVPRNAAQMDPGRIPGSARVTRWWLSRDVRICASGG